MMEDYLQTEWPDLQVLADLDHRAVGRRSPCRGRARATCSRRWSRDVDLSAAAFPHMASPGTHLRRAHAAVPRQLHRRTRLRGQRAGRLRAARVWEASMRSGKPHGITPYGTETMHVLRAEKGYIIVGQETDGTVTPDDVGLGWAIGEDEAGLRRQAFARARDDARCRPQAARRAADERSTSGAGGRRADRRRRSASARR